MIWGRTSISMQIIRKYQKIIPSSLSNLFDHLRCPPKNGSETEIDRVGWKETGEHWFENPNRGPSGAYDGESAYEPYHAFTSCSMQHHVFFFHITSYLLVYNLNVTFVVGFRMLRLIVAF